MKLQEPYYTYMDDEEKWDDMRQYSKTFKKVQEGHRLKFKKDKKSPLLHRLVQKKTVHDPGPDPLRSVFDNHDVDRIIPGFKGTFEDFEDIYYGFGYSRSETRRCGVVVFTLELEPDSSESDSDSLTKTSVVSVSPSPDDEGGD